MPRVIHLSDDHHAFPMQAEKFVATVVELLRIAGNDEVIALVGPSTVEVELGEYDNWNGGTYGWALKVRVSVSVFGALDPAVKKAAEDTILKTGRRLMEEFENHGLSQVLIVPSVAETSPEEEYDTERGFGSREAFFAAREFDLVRRIGGGGFGEIVLVRRRRLGTHLAVKFFSPHPFNADTVERRSKARDRLVREGALLAAIRHPGVVRLMDFSQVMGDPALVLEYIDGSTLNDLRLERGPLQWSEVARLMMQVLSALGACHSQAVVHRDVAPKNVIVESSGRAVLIDFGLGFSEEFIAASRMTTHPLGTPGFRAPELDHDPLCASPTVDVYSAAALTVFMLTGRPPQVGIRVDVDGVPPGALVAIRKALEPDPARRLGSVSDLRQAFSGAVSVAVGPNTRRLNVLGALSDADAREFLRIELGAELDSSVQVLLHDFAAGASAALSMGQEKDVALATLLTCAREELDRYWQVGRQDSRCESDEIASAFGRLVAVLSGAAQVASDAFAVRAFADATKRGWVSENTYDAWVPGMKSGSGMRSRYGATGLGRRWLRERVGFAPSLTTTDAP